MKDSVVTLWFVSTSTPGPVLEASPRADRGFGRKLLAQLNPAWPVSVIGQFALNRSTPASKSEFYIAGYPGITLVQTVVEGLDRISALNPALLSLVDAPQVYACARGVGAERGFGAFAYWHEGTLRRALSARRDTVIEDTGAPEPCEGAYWAGQHPGPLRGGIYLPFDPPELVDAVESAWLGTELGPQGPDLNVVAYAIDGRPAPRLGRAPASTPRVAAGEAYDDYEDHPKDAPPLRLTTPRVRLPHAPALPRVDAAPLKRAATMLLGLAATAGISLRKLFRK